METKRIYRIAFGDTIFETDAALHYRFISWAKENQIDYLETDYTEYTAESYKEESLDSYGGEARPEYIKHCVIFSEKRLMDFFNMLRYFSWKE